MGKIVSNKAELQQLTVVQIEFPSMTYFHHIYFFLKIMYWLLGLNVVHGL